MLIRIIILVVLGTLLYSCVSEDEKKEPVVVTEQVEKTGAEKAAEQIKTIEAVKKEAKLPKAVVISFDKESEKVEEAPAQEKAEEKTEAQEAVAAEHVAEQAEEKAVEQSLAEEPKAEEPKAEDTVTQPAQAVAEPINEEKPQTTVTTHEDVYVNFVAFDRDDVTQWAGTIEDIAPQRTKVTFGEKVTFEQVNEIDEIVITANVTVISQFVAAKKGYVAQEIIIDEID